MDNKGDNVELTHELVEFLGKGNRATGQQGNRATGQQGNRATGQQYDLASVSGHPVFKTIVTLARNSMSGEEIADLLQKILVLMDCYMCCSEITSSSTQGMYMSHILPHPIEMLIWHYAFVCPCWHPVVPVFMPSTQ